jgi:GxxExxY protein
MTDLVYKQEAYKIVGAAFEVHNELGAGFLEAVYQEALAIEFGLRHIPFVEQKKLQLEYKNKILRKRYVPDFFCYDKIVVEIKAISQLMENDTAQILNSLKASHQKLGLLINFGEQTLKWKRYVR